MTTDELSFSVIVCAYTEDRWEALGEAVESVRAQSFPPSEIIVSVDHNPGLLARIRTAFKDVVAVENIEAKGLSGTRNSALAKASGSIIAFLDDDAIAAPDWLAILRDGYADPQVLGVGGSIEPQWVNRRPAWFPDEFNWVVGCTYRGMPRVAAPVRNLIGANMSFRRVVFERLGGFSHSIGRVGKNPAGCEETELCIRARQRWPEKVMLYQPRAKVRHRVPSDRAEWRYFVTRCFGEGKSKAAVSRLVGAKDGLAAERNYTFRTLPTGIARESMAALRGDLAGFGRAGSILAGTSFTTIGYLKGILVRHLDRSPNSKRLNNAARQEVQ